MKPGWRKYALGQTLRDQCSTPFPGRFLCFEFSVAEVISQLPVQAAYCPASPTITNSLSGNRSQNKAHSVHCFGRGRIPRQHRVIACKHKGSLSSVSHPSDDRLPVLATRATQGSCEHRMLCGSWLWPHRPVIPALWRLT